MSMEHPSFLSMTGDFGDYMAPEGEEMGIRQTLVGHAARSLETGARRVKAVSRELDKETIGGLGGLALALAVLGKVRIEEAVTARMARLSAKLPFDQYFRP